MLTLEQGTQLVQLARKAIESKFSIIKQSVPKKIKDEFSIMTGCFVTIHKNGELRGCIGYPEPVLPLYEAIISAAENAAFHDPRFAPLEKSELSEINVEVSVLTKPVRINVRNPEDYIKQITIGKDGIIIRGVYSSGLLLPQVATEYRWNAHTFLQQACIKANLHPNDWQDFDNVRVYKFQSLVFGESMPRAEVIQIM